MGDMDVDAADNPCNASESAKFSNLKAFVLAAREFESMHSEGAVNLMTRNLGLIASSCDLSIFSPGRTEVCAFFSSLWRVMNDGRGPHWAGVAVLSRAAMEPSARHALTHTFKFLPILTRLLSDNISNEKKIKLLSVMQDISYGIKISWQESYLASLLKTLTNWILFSPEDSQTTAIGHKALTVLVNVCYGNLPAIYTLMRTVDTKDFIVHLINLKDGGYGGVEVCRLLLCLSTATRGAAAIRQNDLHSYLNCTMRTFKKAIVERDSAQLLHACTFMTDLCADSNLRGYVLTYSHFATALEDCLLDIEELCSWLPEKVGHCEQSPSCLQNILKFITVLINLDLFSLRCHHSALVSLCMKTSAVCLAESLELFAAVVAQYRDEGRLPQKLISIIAEGLPGLLVPPALEPGKAGLQWLQVVCALSESAETQERVLLEVSPDCLEDTLYSVLQYTAQNGTLGQETGQQAAMLACKTVLHLSPLSKEWEVMLHRILQHHQVRKLLCAGLTSGNASRRRQILLLVKHHCFPADLLNQVFSDNAPSLSDSGIDCQANSSSGLSTETEAMQGVTAGREQAIDSLLQQLNDALKNDKITDIATSSVMELYGYKIGCLEQRLHSHTVALQGATDHMASLQHTLAMLQATNTSQQDVLYTTQMHNEKHKKTIDDLHKQLEDAETTLRAFRAKVTAERLDKDRLRETLSSEFKQQVANIEREIQAREKAAEERMLKIEEDHKVVQKKLEQQMNKNSDLAAVLVKFEERVKQRDKKLEEAEHTAAGLRREIELKDNAIKQLEKTVVERENRLYQLTTQLEEMKRIQEMVAKLMSKSANNASNKFPPHAALCLNKN